MAVRVFTDRDGNEWNVWNVQPTSSTAGLEQRFQNGWLCFERLDGSSRARLSIDDVPPSWEELPDDRLESLRLTAEVASRRRESTILGAQSSQEGEENDARARRSGPRHFIGPDEER
jgi:hypothetical protein